LIIVCHFGVVMSQIQRAEGKGAKHTMRHSIDNLSLTHLSFNLENWSIHAVNFVP
ncbi:MAG: histidine phosphatase family protein, partial [Alphaproteobacteria bacterium]|nr:histidine phosphatase family protein [Alphaproteobacteria bacterium]